MNAKPISPLAHGLIDYALVTAMLTVPAALDARKKTTKLYRILGAGLGVYNALTAHGAAVRGLIPFRTHYKVDYGNLAGLLLLTVYKGIRNHRKTLLFHAAFLSLATATVLLTDWKGETKLES